MNRVGIFFTGFGFYNLGVTCHSTFTTAYYFPPKIWKSPTNSRRQKGEMKQVPSWAPTIIDIWCSQLGVSEVAHVFKCKQRKMQ